MNITGVDIELNFEHVIVMRSQEKEGDGRQIEKDSENSKLHLFMDEPNYIMNILSRVENQNNAGINKEDHLDIFKVAKRISFKEDWSKGNRVNGIYEVCITIKDSVDHVWFVAFGVRIRFMVFWAL